MACYEKTVYTEFKLKNKALLSLFPLGHSLSSALVPEGRQSLCCSHFTRTLEATQEFSVRNDTLEQAGRQQSHTTH
uniref:Uncharacterized protein n=1 Tax=Myripristis murdjan TaxID=586833 RepID=A0A667Z117_9TELE